MTRLALALALALSGCSSMPEVSCEYMPADANCSASSYCLTCYDAACATYSEEWFAEDGSGRSWLCDGDNDGSGYPDCIEDMVAATCDF